MPPRLVICTADSWSALNRAFRRVDHEGEVGHRDASPDKKGRYPERDRSHAFLFHDLFWRQLVSQNLCTGLGVGCSLDVMLQGSASHITEICAVKGRPCKGHQRAKRSPISPAQHFWMYGPRSPILWETMPPLSQYTYMAMGQNPIPPPVNIPIPTKMD